MYVPQGRRSPWSAIGGVLPLLVMAAYWSKPTPPLLHIVFASASYAVGLVFHELGHALVASLLGMRVTGVFIGLGPPVASFRVARVPVVIQAVPLSGIVHLLLRSRRFGRTRLAAAFAAGPLANALLVVLGIAAFDRVPMPKGIIGHELGTFAGINAFMCFANLIPIKRRTVQAGAPRATDGYQLLRVHRTAAKTIDAMITTASLFDAIDQTLDGRPEETLKRVEPMMPRMPDNPVALLVLGDAYAELGRYADAITAYLSFPRHTLPDAAPAIENAVSWCLIRGYGRSRAKCATRLSRRALKSDPENANYLHTHAAILVVRQKLAKATRVLEALPRKRPKLRPGVIGSLRAELALARGDIATAEREIKAASRFRPTRMFVEASENVRLARATEVGDVHPDEVRVPRLAEAVDDRRDVSRR